MQTAAGCCYLSSCHGVYISGDLEPTTLENIWDATVLQTVHAGVKRKQQEVELKHLKQQNGAIERPRAWRKTHKASFSSDGLYEDFFFIVVFITWAEEERKTNMSSYSEFSRTSSMEVLLDQAGLSDSLICVSLSWCV